MMHENLETRQFELETQRPRPGMTQFELVLRRFEVEKTQVVFVSPQVVFVWWLFDLEWRANVDEMSPFELEWSHFLFEWRPFQIENTHFVRPADRDGLEEARNVLLETVCGLARTPFELELPPFELEWSQFVFVQTPSVLAGARYEKLRLVSS